MFSLTNLLSPLAICISLTTATSVLVHDTNIDKVANIMALPAVVATMDPAVTNVRLGNDLHTHAERVSLSQAVRDMRTSEPRIQTRTDNRKYVLQKNVMRGFDPFDVYTLPLV